MTWDPVDYDNITLMKIPFDEIWTPGNLFDELLPNLIKIINIIPLKKIDTFLYNAADTNSWYQWDTSSMSKNIFYKI